MSEKPEITDTDKLVKDQWLFHSALVADLNAYFTDRGLDPNDVPSLKEEALTAILISRAVPIPSLMARERAE